MENYESATQAVLEGIREVYDKYVIFPSDAARDVATLWVAHSWAHRYFSATPRIFFNANEPASGKTRAAEVTANMGPSFYESGNAQPSMIYTILRDVNNGPTFFFDETDKTWGTYGTKKQKEELVRILNTGFHRDKETLIGRSGNYVKAPVSCPVVFAGLGDSLPRDLMTRTIKVTMRKVSDDQSESLEEFTSENYELDFLRIHEALEIWARDFAPYLDLIAPDVPFRDRRKEAWRPLISIASLAGDEWENRAVRAAKVIEAGGSVPMSTLLLFDVETILRGDEFSGRDFVFTEEIQSHLTSGFGWDEKFVQARVFSNILRPHGVEPTHGSVDNVKGRGYRVRDLLKVVKALR